MVGAVVAFVVQLQQLPPDNVLRSVSAAWPLILDGVAWATYDGFVANNTPSELIERSLLYVTVPQVGAPVCCCMNGHWA